MQRSYRLIAQTRRNIFHSATATLRNAPSASLLRSYTTTTAKYSPQSGSSTVSDARPASAQIFSPEEVQAGIKALADQGYDADSVWEQRVVWGDHDQFQHVNNVHFVRWFESSRMFFCEKMTSLTDKTTGEKLFTEERKKELARGTGKSMILANINVRYRRPVVYPDTILIGQSCELPLPKDRFNLRAVAYSLSQKTVVALSTQDCVAYDYTKLAKCDIPPDLKQALETKGTHFAKK